MAWWYLKLVLIHYTQYASIELFEVVYCIVDNIIQFVYLN